MTFTTDNGSIYHEGRWYVDAELNATGRRGDQGLEFPNSGIYFDSPDVTVEDVRTISKSSPIVASSLEKYRRFCFTGAKLVVTPPVDDQTITEDDIHDLQAKVDQADRVVRTVLRINQAWMDKKVYGSGIFEYKIGKTAEFEKGPVLFKRLPAHSFDTTPPDRDGNEDRYIPGDILLGIIYDNEENVYEYWQRQSSYGDPVQIDSRNILHIRDEIADSPDGRSLVAQITGLVKRLQYTEQALMQYVHRVGAPGLWAEIQDYVDKDAALMASNPAVWSFDEAFKQGKKIIKNWGKDTVIVTPSRIQLKPLNFTVPLNPMDVIDHFERRILYTIIARDFTEQMGQAISHSAAPGLSLLTLMARNEQDEISEPFCEWWNKILEANGYEGWRVTIEWRDLTEDSEDQMYMRSEIAAKVGAWTIDEIREIAGWEPLTDDQRDELGISEEAKEEAARLTAIASGATPTPEERENQPATAIEEDSEVVLNASKDEVELADLLSMKGTEFEKFLEGEGITFPIET